MKVGGVLLALLALADGDKNVQFNHCLLPKDRVMNIIQRHFKVDNELGTGFFGVVYRATDKESKSVVALKLFKNRNMKNCFMTWGQLGLDMRFKEADLPQLIWEKSTSSQKDYFVPILRDLGKSTWEPALMTMELLEKTKYSAVEPNLNDRSNTLLSIYTSIQALHAYSALISPPTPIVHKDFHFGNFQYRHKDWKLKLYDFSIATMCSTVDGCNARDLRRLASWMTMGSILAGGVNSVEEFIRDWEAKHNIASPSNEGCGLEGKCANPAAGWDTPDEEDKKGKRKKRVGGPKLNVEADLASPAAPVVPAGGRRTTAGRGTAGGGRGSARGTYGTQAAQQTGGATGKADPRQKSSEWLEEILVSLATQPHVLNSFGAFRDLIGDIVAGEFDLNFYFQHLSEQELIALRQQGAFMPYKWEEFNGKTRTFDQVYERVKHLKTGEVKEYPMLDGDALESVRKKKHVNRGGIVDELGQHWFTAEDILKAPSTQVLGYTYKPRDLNGLIPSLAEITVGGPSGNRTPEKAAAQGRVFPWAVSKEEVFGPKWEEELGFAWEAFRLATGVELLRYPSIAGVTRSGLVAGEEEVSAVELLEKETGVAPVTSSVALSPYPAVTLGKGELFDTESESTVPAWVTKRVAALAKSPRFTEEEMEDMEDNDETVLHQNLLAVEECLAYPCSVAQGCDPPSLMSSLANPTQEARFAARANTTSAAPSFTPDYPGSIPVTPVLSFRGLTMGWADVPSEFEYFERVRVANALRHGSGRLLKPIQPFDDSPVYSDFMPDPKEPGRMMAITKDDAEYRLKTHYDPDHDEEDELMMYGEMKTSTTELGVMGMALAMGGMEVGAGEVAYPYSADPDFIPHFPEAAKWVAALVNARNAIAQTADEAEKEARQREEQAALRELGRFPDWLVLLAQETQAVEKIEGVRNAALRFNDNGANGSLGIKRVIWRRDLSIARGEPGIDKAGRQDPAALVKTDSKAGPAETGFGGEIARRMRRLIMCHPYVRKVRNLVGRWLERPAAKLMPLPPVDKMPYGTCVAFRPEVYAVGRKY